MTLEAMSAEDRERFERLILPHLDAAFNLARWLMRSRTDAEDAAQEAMLRAYRFFGGYQGGDSKSWLLRIVRNTCYTWLEKNRPADLSDEFNEEIHMRPGATPEDLAIALDDREQLKRGLEALPARFRELLVLREFEGMSYKEIASVASMPIGSVMSTLSRARGQLQRLVLEMQQEAHHEL